MEEMMLVRAGRADGQVALWDRNPAHPDGEAWVCGGTPVLVARTRAVLAGLADGRLVEVEAAQQPVPEAVVGEAEPPATDASEPSAEEAPSAGEDALSVELPTVADSDGDATATAPQPPKAAGKKRGKP
jgi:hypothetical protein